MCIRDSYKGDIVADIKTLKKGDKCPVCGAPVTYARGKMCIRDRTNISAADRTKKFFDHQVFT